VSLSKQEGRSPLILDEKAAAAVTTTAAATTVCAL